MKKYIFLLLTTCTIYSAIAQTEGVVIFKEQMKLQLMIEGLDSNMLKNLPKERITLKELHFTADASMYSKSKENKSMDIDEIDETGGRMVFKIDEPEEFQFADIKNKKCIEQRDVFSRVFLVESDFSEQKWKMTGNQKMIHNYPCQEAVAVDSTRNLSVWFTPAIPVSTGPFGMANLPGLILEAHLEDPNISWIAESVNMTAVDKSKIVSPTKGKKMTKPEFRKMVDQKRKEMQEENGGKGNVIIKMNRE